MIVSCAFEMADTGGNLRNGSEGPDTDNAATMTPHPVCRKTRRQKADVRFSGESADYRSDRRPVPYGPRSISEARFERRLSGRFRHAAPQAADFLAFGAM